MSGYTPLFSSLTEGTLCGRWPDIGLWPIVLSMADRFGVVDKHHNYIAGVTGLQVDEVIACMARFCEPDPKSRSDTANGARLVLLDSHRDWGWQIVNFEAYREKARKAAYDRERVESGIDAARKRVMRASKRPAVSGDVPTSPDASRVLPLSDSDSNSDKNKNPPTPQGGEVVEGLNLEAFKQWDQYRKAIKKPIKGPSRQAAMQALAAFGDEQMSVVRNSMANGYQGLFAPKEAATMKTRFERAKDAIGETHDEGFG